jgi:hypothetical protein
MSAYGKERVVNDEHNRPDRMPVLRIVVLSDHCRGLWMNECELIVWVRVTYGGQSGRPSTFERASFQTQMAERLMRM